MKAILDKWQNLSRQELRWMIQAIIDRRGGVRKSDYNDMDLELAVGAFTLKEKIRLNAWIKDRVISHKPLQYILRSQPFCGLDLKTRLPTLIPRWETEEWTLKVIEILKQYIQKHSSKELRVLDLCSGSGCISLAIAHHLSNTGIKLHIIGIDHALSAVALASVNQRKIGICKDVLSFVHADIFNKLPLSGSFDLIVSNPPYISYDQMKEMDQGVLNWEDHSALFAKDEGLLFYKRILKLVPDLLNRNGLSTVVLEIDGDNQAQSIMNMAQDSHSCQVWKDMAGNTRSIYFKYSSEIE